MQDPKPHDLRPAVEEALMDVRGALAFHGGDVELVDITPDGTVHVRLQGACSGCPMADMTVSSLIESTLVERVPGVTGVVNLPR